MMTLFFLKCLRLMQKLWLLPLISLLMAEVAFAKRNIELCLLKPQKQNVSLLLEELESSPEGLDQLKSWAQQLNPSKDLDADVISYNVLLPWRTRPSNDWIFKHCHKVGYISETRLDKARSDKWSSFSMNQLGLVDVAAWLSQPDTNADFGSRSKPSWPVKSKRPEKSEALETYEDRQKKAILNSSLLVEASPVAGIEFLNARGMGIENKISAWTAGVDVGVIKNFGQRFSVFGRYRYVGVIYSYSEEPTQEDLTDEYDIQWSAGFNIKPFSRLTLGASYKYVSWLLLERGTPTFVIESFRERMHTWSAHFDFKFTGEALKGWGLYGAYGGKLSDKESSTIKDFRTLLYFKWTDPGIIYRIYFGYELNSYKYEIAGPSSVDEVNRNRYLIGLSMTSDLF